MKENIEGENWKQKNAGHMVVPRRKEGERQKEKEKRRGRYLVKALPSGSASPTSLQQTQNNKPSRDRLSVLKNYMREFKCVCQDRRHEC